MEKYLDKRIQIRSHVPFATALNDAHRVQSIAGSPGLDTGCDDRALRFPPTRAARASRSRGVFLAEGGKMPSQPLPRWIAALGVLGAAAVAALAFAVCVNTAPMLATAAFGANPGPAIAAAASVVPPFMLPAESR
jgi:hypothetical protein